MGWEKMPIETEFNFFLQPEIFHRLFAPCNMITKSHLMSLKHIKPKY